MKEHPILFKPEMVRALLAGRKTQTRRLATKDLSTTKIKWVKDYPTWPPLWKDRKRKRYTGWIKQCGSPIDIPLRCPYGVPGDQLWVRETWQGPILCAENGNMVERFFYRATDKRRINHKGKPIKWKPSIHMFRRDSRIDLEVTSIRVERVQEISDGDCKKEGFGIYSEGTWLNYVECGYTLQGEYKKLWNSINGKDAWDKNPWVWVIGFNLMNGK